MQDVSYLNNSRHRGIAFFLDFSSISVVPSLPFVPVVLTAVSCFLRNRASTDTLNRLFLTIFLLRRTFGQFARPFVQPRDEFSESGSRRKREKKEWETKDDSRNIMRNTPCNLVSDISGISSIFLF